MIGLRQWIPSPSTVRWVLLLAFVTEVLWEMTNLRKVRVAVSVETVLSGLGLQMRKNTSAEQEMAFWFVCPMRNVSCVAGSKRLYLINDDRVGATAASRSMHVTLESPPPNGWKYAYPEVYRKNDYIPILVTNLDLTLQQNWYNKWYISAEADITVEFYPRFKSRLRRWIWYSEKWMQRTVVLVLTPFYIVAIHLYFITLFGALLIDPRLAERLWQYGLWDPFKVLTRF